MCLQPQEKQGVRSRTLSEKVLADTKGFASGLASFLRVFYIINLLVYLLLHFFFKSKGTTRTSSKSEVFPLESMSDDHKVWCACACI